MGHTDAIEAEYLAAALLAHPAEHEGWGLAVTEAMAAGVPAVGFADCPGVNQLIRDGVNGLLVRAGRGPRRQPRRGAGRADARRGAAGPRSPTPRPASVTGYAPEKVIDLWERMLYDGAERRTGGDAWAG